MRSDIGRHESLNVKALLNLETDSRNECKCAYVSVRVTCVTKGSIRGTMPSSMVRAIASRHVAPAIAMLQLSSPSRSSCSAVIKGREGSRKRDGQNEGQ